MRGLQTSFASGEKRAHVTCITSRSAETPANIIALFLFFGKGKVRRHDESPTPAARTVLGPSGEVRPVRHGSLRQCGQSFHRNFSPQSSKI